MGIRNPGRDGVWGATFDGNDGEFENRNPGVALAPKLGQVFGPYLELRDKGLLGKLDGTIDAVTGQRVVAYHWDENLPLENRLQQAAAPAAWPQLGGFPRPRR